MRNLSLKVLVLTSLVFAGTAEAGLLGTDSAAPVAAGHFEAELNGAYTIDKKRSGSDTAKCHATESDLTVTAGLTDGTDISATLPYTLTSREKIGGSLARRDEGFNDLTVAIKYRFFDSSGLQLAIKPGVILPTGNSSEGLSDGRSGVTAALLATKEVRGGKLVLHANAGYEHHDYRDAATREAARGNIFTFSLAGEATAAAGLILAVDLCLATAADKSMDTPALSALGGATYEISKMLETYAGIKAGLTKPADDLTALAGIKVKF